MALNQNQRSEFEQLLKFLTEIELPVQISSHRPQTFIPGVWIENSQVFCNPDLVECLGDIAHESAHLAITPSEFRRYWLPSEFALGRALTTVPPLLPSGQENPLFSKLINGDEQAAIAWSYAAAVKCGINVKDMHLKKHFDGEWENLTFSLQIKCHAGVNNLHHIGMTTKTLFPELLKWIQV